MKLVPFSTIARGFVDGLRAGSLRKALLNASRALTDVLGQETSGVIGFSVEGKTGETKMAHMHCHEWFRGEKLILIGSEHGGMTLVANFVGNKNQFPFRDPDSGVPTEVFGPTCIDNEYKMDVCRPGSMISYTVKFHKDARLDGSLFGKTIS